MKRAIGINRRSDLTLRFESRHQYLPKSTDQAKFTATGLPLPSTPGEAFKRMSK